MLPGHCTRRAGALVDHIRAPPDEPSAEMDAGMLTPGATRDRTRVPFHAQGQT